MYSKTNNKFFLQAPSNTLIISVSVIQNSAQNRRLLDDLKTMKIEIAKYKRYFYISAAYELLTS